MFTFRINRSLFELKILDSFCAFFYRARLFASSNIISDTKIVNDFVCATSADKTKVECRIENEWVKRFRRCDSISTRSYRLTLKVKVLIECECMSEAQRSEWWTQSDIIVLKRWIRVVRLMGIFPFRNFQFVSMLQLLRWYARQTWTIIFLLSFFTFLLYSTANRFTPPSRFAVFTFLVFRAFVCIFCWISLPYSVNVRSQFTETEKTDDKSNENVFPIPNFFNFPFATATG